MKTDGKRTAGRWREKKACRDDSRLVFGPGGTHRHTQINTDSHTHTHTHARMTVSGTVVQKRSCEEGEGMRRPPKFVLC